MYVCTYSLQAGSQVSVFLVFAFLCGIAHNRRHFGTASKNKLARLPGPENQKIHSPKRTLPCYKPYTLLVVAFSLSAFGTTIY